MYNMAEYDNYILILALNENASLRHIDNHNDTSKCILSNGFTLKPAINILTPSGSVLAHYQLDT